MTGPLPPDFQANIEFEGNADWIAEYEYRLQISGTNQSTVVLLVYVFQEDTTADPFPGVYPNPSATIINERTDLPELVTYWGTWRLEDGTGLNTTTRPALSVHVFSFPYDPAPGAGITFFPSWVATIVTGGVNGYPNGTFTGNAYLPVPDDHLPTATVAVLFLQIYGFDNNDSLTKYRGLINEVIVNSGHRGVINSPTDKTEVDTPFKSLLISYTLFEPQEPYIARIQSTAIEPAVFSYTGILNPGDSVDYAYTIPGGTINRFGIDYPIQIIDPTTSSLWYSLLLATASGLYPTYILDIRFQAAMDSLDGSFTLQIQDSTGTWHDLTVIERGSWVFNNPMAEMDIHLTIPVGGLTKSGHFRITNPATNTDPATINNFHLHWPSVHTTEIEHDPGTSVSLTLPPYPADYDVFGDRADAIDGGTKIPFIHPKPTTVNVHVEGPGVTPSYAYNNDSVTVPTGRFNATSPVNVTLDPQIYASYLVVNSTNNTYQIKFHYENVTFSHPGSGSPPWAQIEIQDSAGAWIPLTGSGNSGFSTTQTFTIHLSANALLPNPLPVHWLNVDSFGDASFLTGVTVYFLPVPAYDLYLCLWQNPDVHFGDTGSVIQHLGQFAVDSSLTLPWPYIPEPLDWYGFTIFGTSSNTNYADFTFTYEVQGADTVGVGVLNHPVFYGYDPVDDTVLSGYGPLRLDTTLHTFPLQSPDWSPQLISPIGYEQANYYSFNTITGEFANILPYGYFTSDNINVPRVGIPITMPLDGGVGELPSMVIDPMNWITVTFTLTGEVWVARVAGGNRVMING